MSTTSHPLHRELPQRRRRADDDQGRWPPSSGSRKRRCATGATSAQGRTASGLPDQHRDDSLRCFPPDSHELAERFRRRWAPSRHQGGPGRLFVNREFLQLLVRAEPSPNGLRTDGREGRHLHVSIPADAEIPVM
jgi:hypothetical protein